MIDHFTVRQYSKLKFYIYSCFVCWSTVLGSRYIPVRCKALCWGILSVSDWLIMNYYSYCHALLQIYCNICFVCCGVVPPQPIQKEKALGTRLMSSYMYAYVFVPFSSKALCWGLLHVSVVYELKCFDVKILFQLSSSYWVPWDDALDRIVSSGGGFELDTFKLYNYWFYGIV